MDGNGQKGKDQGAGRGGTRSRAALLSCHRRAGEASLCRAAADGNNRRKETEPRSKACKEQPEEEQETSVSPYQKNRGEYCRVVLLRMTRNRRNETEWGSKACKERPEEEQRASALPRHHRRAKGVLPLCAAADDKEQKRDRMKKHDTQGAGAGGQGTAAPLACRRRVAESVAALRRTAVKTSTVLERSKRQQGADKSKVTGCQGGRGLSKNVPCRKNKGEKIGAQDQDTMSGPLWGGGQPVSCC